MDRQDGSGSSQGKKGKNRGGTRLDYFDEDGRLLFRSVVPASPGDASLSFFGVVFDEPVVGSVRIVTGNEEPGDDDEGKTDIVVMDDFIYGEPQPIP